jgi:hypothetical protein
VLTPLRASPSAARRSPSPRLLNPICPTGGVAGDSRYLGSASRPQFPYELVTGERAVRDRMPPGPNPKTIPPPVLVAQTLTTGRLGPNLPAWSRWSLVNARQGGTGAASCAFSHACPIGRRPHIICNGLKTGSDHHHDRPGCSQSGPESTSVHSIHAPGRPRSRHATYPSGLRRASCPSRTPQTLTPLDRVAHSISSRFICRARLPDSNVAISSNHRSHSKSRK